jgi:hypothetical protein
MMDCKVPETPYMTAGKVAHEVIQNHCIDKKPDRRFVDLWNFQKAEWNFRAPYNKKFGIGGRVDLINFKTKVFGEIKTGNSKLPPMSKFDTEIAFYAFGTNFRKAYFISCLQDLSAHKTSYREITAADIQKAKDWIDGACAIIEKGDYLHEKCDGSCPYGSACYVYNNTI